MSTKPLRVGIIGFDTSHVPAFTQLLNDSSDPFHVAGAQVVCGVPTFSPDLPASASRVEEYTRHMRERGVEILDSIEALLERVDAVLLHSLDGRRHLAEATPVLKARKPVFIDKPFAANYCDAAEIVRRAKEYDCPLFSSSSLRFDVNMLALQSQADLGQVLACDSCGQGTLEPTNPGLLWYGIHAVEILYSFMGTGCQSVYCSSTDAYDLVIGKWPDGRQATVRAVRVGVPEFAVTVHREKGVQQGKSHPEIPFYYQLLQQIVPFFQSGKSPVAPEETLEMIAFMQAAHLSGQQKREVELQEIVSCQTQPAL